LLHELQVKPRTKRAQHKHSKRTGDHR
jgi:hypothetical protein